MNGVLRGSVYGSAWKVESPGEIEQCGTTKSGHSPVDATASTVLRPNVIKAVRTDCDDAMALILSRP